MKYIVLTFQSPIGPYYAATYGGRLLKQHDGQPFTAWDANLLRLWVAEAFGYEEEEPEAA